LTTAVLILALAAAGAFAETPASEPPDSLSGREGWVKTPSSLLLFDSSGTLVSEIGLGAFEEPAGTDTVARRKVRAGVSADGRFAWSFEKKETVRPGKSDKPLTTTRLFIYWGTEGRELFRNELADAPPGLEPAALSADGERLLVAERAPDGWIVAAYDFTGDRMVDARGKGALELAQITPDGRFALVRWHLLDERPRYVFLRVHDRESEALKTRETARLLNDGRVMAGAKVLAAP